VQMVRGIAPTTSNTRRGAALDDLIAPQTTLPVTRSICGLVYRSVLRERKTSSGLLASADEVIE